MMARSVLATALIALCVCLVTGGCSDGEQPDPVVAVELEEGPVTVPVAETYPFTATVLGGETKSLHWYVDEILGGNDSLGTITQTNPAIYSAPSEVPPSDTIAILAVSVEDPTKADACQAVITEQSP
jgi:hypothetical protein